ncbi:MAG: hypothetical protein PHE33_09470 [Bacteroidales bacterium]|nr:hypothetical protein [Bacteroidales bacterium]
MKYINGISRNQLVLFPLSMDLSISEDNEVHSKQFNNVSNIEITVTMPVLNIKTKVIMPVLNIKTKDTTLALNTKTKVTMHVHSGQTKGTTLVVHGGHVLGLVMLWFGFPIGYARVGIGFLIWCA